MQQLITQVLAPAFKNIGPSIETVKGPDGKPIIGENGLAETITTYPDGSGER